MKAYGKKLAEGLAFAIVVVLIAWFDGSITPAGARPLWFQVTTRLVIYTAIFFAVSLVVDAIFAGIGKK